MAQLVKLKRTSVPGRIPTTSNLELGELAINTYDGRIFFEKNDGTISIQEILTTNASNSGSFNLTGAISASSFVSASSFIGDGSQLTFGGTGLVSGSSQITDGSGIVSGSSQLATLGFAITGSNTFTGAQTIQNSAVGGNYSLIVQGSTTGDKLGIGTNSTAGSGITITSRNASNSGNTPLNFSGSSFEFGGGDVTFLNNVTIDGTLTINSAADVLIEENTLKLNYGNSFSSGGLEVSTLTSTGSLLWDETTSKWIAGTLGNELPILLDNGGVVSGSSQILGGTGILSSSNETFTEFSSSVDSRLDALETDTGSQDNRLDLLESATASLDSRLDNVETTTSSFESRIAQLETETGSISTAQDAQDGRLDSLESFTSSLSTTEYTYSGSFSGSFVGDGSQLSGVTSYTDADTLAYINSQGVVSGSDQIKDVLTSLNSYTSSNDITISNLESTTSSFEDRLSQLETETGSISTAQDVQDGRLDNIETYTSSLKTAISVSGTNLTVLGNLDVQGTTTTVDSQTVQIGDNIIELNGSGAANGGIHVKDSTNPNTDTGSLIWDSTNDYWKAGTKGSESEIITISNIVTNLPTGTVSGSSQIDADSVTNFDSNVLSYINILGVVSGSTQVTTALPTGTISGSQQVIDSLPSGTISGSSQITNGSGILSSSNENFITFSSSVDLRLDQLETDTGSQDSRLDLLESYTSSQDNKNSTLATYTSSVDVSLSSLNTYTSSQDNINSGYNSFTSSYFTDSASFDSRLDQLETDTGSQDGRLDSLEAYTASLDITNAILTGSFTGSFVGDGSGLTGVVANGTVSGSDQLTGSLNAIYEQVASGTHTLVSSSVQVVEFLPVGVVSGSTQTIANLGGSGIYSSSNQVVSSLSNQSVNFGTGDITANSFSGDGSNLTNISVTQAATVADTFTNTNSITVTHNFNTRNVIVAVYDSSNNQIIPSNVNTTNLDQVVISLSGNLSGTVVVAKGGHVVSGTASQLGGKFMENVDMNTYTLSGSGNIDFVGDLTVNGNTTITGTLTLSNADDIRIEDNTLLLNWGKGNTDGGLEVSSNSGATGSLLWDESDGAWKGGVKGSESKFLLAGGDGILSGSSQIVTSLPSGTVSGSQQVIDVINVEGVVSGGAQLAGVFDNYQYWTAIADSGANISVNGASATNTLDFQGGNGISTEAISTGTRFIEITLDTGSNHFIAGAQAASSADVTSLQSYTSSLKQAIEVSGTNLTVLGDLTVQGTNTSLNTTQLLIEDKLITLASGSTTSVQADGAGIEIQGASKSLIWDHTSTAFLFDAMVSSSVGFRGDGSNLTFNGTGIVSSSQQVINHLPTGTVSGSTQITNGSEIVSSSQQVIDHLPTGTVSGSAQTIANLPTGTLSGSQQVVDSLPTGTISGSDQLPSGLISGSTYTTFSSSVDSRLDAVESYTGSLDINNAILTGSFTGSFTGDGSGLTGLTVDQVASITASFSNQSTINVGHNFNTYNVITSVYDSNYSQLIPQSVTLTDTNTLQVVLSGAHSGHVVVAKGGHVISSQDTYTATVSGNTSYTITHNLDSEYPFVQAWNTSTKKIEQPQDVESNSANAITVTFSGVFGGKIIVKK